MSDPNVPSSQPDSDSWLDSRLKQVSSQSTPASGSGTGMWMPPPAWHLQELLPAYEVLEVLGRGGMGAVYKARQISLDRLVAIKILPPDIADDEVNYAGRFKVEARSMARLSHPGIVGLIEFGETGEGQLYMVLEFIEGTDLAKLLEQRATLPPVEALQIAGHVCGALEYAHARGVIHRDIKPANIMIEKGGAVKVADFGLAKLTAGTDGLTLTHMVMGTPDYIAPESFLGMSLADHRADVFAVGVMLYRMITGAVPRGAYVKPSARVAGLDPALDDLIGKAMEAEREHRFQSAAALREAIEALLPTAGTRVSRSQRDATSPKTRTRPPERRRKPGGPWMMAGLGMLAVAALTAIWIWRTQHRPAATSLPAERAEVLHPSPPLAPPAPPPPKVVEVPPVLPPKATADASDPAKVAPNPAAMKIVPTPALAAKSAPVASAPETLPAPSPIPAVSAPTHPQARTVLREEVLVEASKVANETRINRGSLTSSVLTAGALSPGTPDKQALVWTGFHVDDTLLLPVDIPVAGNYWIEGRLVRGPQRAQMLVTMNGRPLSRGAIDLAGDYVALTPHLDWGVHPLSAGRQTLSFRVAGMAPDGAEGGLAIESVRFTMMTGSPTPAPLGAVARDTPRGSPALVVEFEKLTGSAKSGTLWLKNADRFRKFSGGQAREWRDLSKDNVLSWKLPVARPGPYHLRLKYAFSGKYKVRITLGEKQLALMERKPSSISSTASAEGIQDLGWVELVDGAELTFRMEEAQDASLTFDALFLEPENVADFPAIAAASSTTPATLLWTDVNGQTLAGKFVAGTDGKLKLNLDNYSWRPPSSLNKLGQQYAFDLAQAMEKKATPPISEMMIRLRVDREARIKLGSTLSLESTGPTQPDSLAINGRPWQPVWSGQATVPISLPQNWRRISPGRDFEVTRIQGRGFVDILEEPNAENGGTLVVRVTDEPEEADTYLLRVRW